MSAPADVIAYQAAVEAKLIQGLLRKGRALDDDLTALGYLDEARQLHRLLGSLRAKFVAKSEEADQ